MKGCAAFGVGRDPQVAAMHSTIDRLDRQSHPDTMIFGRKKNASKI